MILFGISLCFVKIVTVLVAPPNLGGVGADRFMLLLIFLIWESKFVGLAPGTLLLSVFALNILIHVFFRRKITISPMRAISRGVNNGVIYFSFF